MFIGNFHAIIPFKGEEDLPLVSAAVHRLVHRAIALDGTCTGEHGVGIGKKEYLVDELGPDTVALMRSVKNAIDPLNIMNPSKVNLRNRTMHKLTSLLTSFMTALPRGRNYSEGPLILHHVNFIFTFHTLHMISYCHNSFKRE